MRIRSMASVLAVVALVGVTAYARFSGHSPLYRQTTPAAALPDGLQATLARIERGERFPSHDDGTVFQNREQRLPGEPRGYYREYVHPTPGAYGPGARRVIIGQRGEVYYTRDHYQSFTRMK